MIVIALLILIVLILLFGAGAIRGCIASAASIVAAAVALVWVASLLGKDGPFWMMVAGGACGLALALASAVYKANRG